MNPGAIPAGAVRVRTLWPSVRCAICGAPMKRSPSNGRSFTYARCKRGCDYSEKIQPLGVELRLHGRHWIEPRPLANAPSA